MSAIRARLLARSPPLALLEVADWDCVAAKQPENVLKSILDDPEDVGLRSVPGYRVELLEVRARDYGLPHGGHAASHSNQHRQSRGRTLINL